MKRMIAVLVAATAVLLVAALAVEVAGTMTVRTVTVGTSAVVLSPASSRLVERVIKTGKSDVWVGPNSTVVTNSVQKGTFVIAAESVTNCSSLFGVNYTGPIYAIATNEAQCVVVEFTNP